MPTYAPRSATTKTIETPEPSASGLPSPEEGNQALLEAFGLGQRMSAPAETDAPTFEDPWWASELAAPVIAESCQDGRDDVPMSRQVLGQDHRSSGPYAYVGVDGSSLVAGAALSSQTDKDGVSTQLLHAEGQVGTWNQGNDTRTGVRAAVDGAKIDGGFRDGASASVGCFNGSVDIAQGDRGYDFEDQFSLIGGGVRYGEWGAQGSLLDGGVPLAVHCSDQDLTTCAWSAGTEGIGVGVEHGTVAK